jgi:hypothetical protein
MVNKIDSSVDFKKMEIVTSSSCPGSVLFSMKGANPDSERAPMATVLTA